ncbi:MULTISPECIES: ATP-binding protein [Streptomyces]|uniref:ATP-binding protein n=1 Tax=Streptomyces TaxID=1883 RepID=UPI001C2E8E93|nr:MULTISPECIES: ATP-binding protein [Streptomyces]MBV1949292.1 ATP-binding protein [Streptomyces sp. BV129]BDH05647.1 ATPase [Streptomyces seoulensis]
MCEQHATSIPAVPRQSRRTMAYRPADARRAVRRVVTERCRDRSLDCADETLEDALLVASELTTNAILHGGGITCFEVDVDTRGVRLSVSDRSDELPDTTARSDAEADRSRTGGRGWPIVSLLARDVRVAGLPLGGKCVTAVVPLR